MTTQELSEKLLKSALALAQRGWPVFPCHVDKSPYLKGGFSSASTDLEQINSWWRKWPTASIGVPTGATIGCFVLDVDLPEGPASLSTLEEQHGHLPETTEQRTGSGGRQLFFVLPDGVDVRNSTSKVGRNLDIRGNGGYVIVPPSGHPSGGHYAWTSARGTAPAAAAPQWLLELALKPKLKPKSEPTAAPSGKTSDTKGKQNSAQKVLQSACEKITNSPSGEQHETRRDQARLVGGYLQHLDEQEAYDALEQAVIASGAQDVAKAMRTVQDGLEHGKLNPCTIPDKEQPSSALAKSPTPDEEVASFLPPPPRVPVEVFPAVLQEIIRNAARAFVVPLEVPVCAVLALASACIGRVRGIIIKEGWAPHANLYLALVGLSGTGKSPCASAIMKSAYRVDFEMHREWQQASADYLLEKEKYREAVRQYRKGEIQDPGPPPEKPKRRQVLVDDATVESLTDALADNPRGILWIRDELAGLLLDLDKYQGEKGSTKTRLMSSYDSGPWKVGRVNQERTNYIPHATLSIFGTIQPAALADIFCGQDAATGFLPRFLFVRFVPDRPGIWTDCTFSKSRRAEQDHITRALLALDFDSADQPKFIGVKKDAKALYVAWHDRLAMEAWMGTSDDENSVLSKLRDQCLRLALILHLLRAVTEEQSDTAPVMAETMGKAILLADWFREHQRHAWALIGSSGRRASEAAPVERRVVQAILALQGEITGATLPTSRITEQVNAGVEKVFQLDVRAIGKACKRLGLTSKPTNTARMTIVDEAALARLRTLAGCTSAMKGQGNSDVCDVSEKNVTAENPHDSRASDMSDVCDVSQGADTETAVDPPNRRRRVRI